MPHAHPHRVRLRPRTAAWLAAAAGAMALHGLVLIGDERPPARAAHGMQTIRVRTVEPRAPQADTPIARPLEPVAQPAQHMGEHIAESVAAPVAGPLAEPRAPTPRRSARRAAATTRERASHFDVPADGLVPVAGAPLRHAAPESFPVYRATPAPPARLRYDMTRGLLSGRGDLVWTRSGERYELRLEASIAGLAVLTETSTGTVGANGLAPLRYTDQRVRGGTHAANFQRDKGKVTYSGPSVEFALPAGAQDRLSWMMQLGAVLNADPQVAAPGGKVVFFVTGARGDADAWIFRYAGRENVSSPGGVIRAVKFTREPRQTYDRLVEIWLAPQREHLPVRARFTATANGEIFELLLRDIGAP